MPRPLFPKTTFPVLYTLCLVAFWANPRPFQAAIGIPWQTTLLKDLLPPFPQNNTIAYQIGALSCKLNNSNYDQAELLRNISWLLERPERPVSAAQIPQLKAELILAEKGDGVVARIWGAFTLVNIIWILSIMGILAFTIPALYFCGVLQMLGVILINFGILLGHLFFQCAEAIVYSLSFWLIVESTVMISDSATIVCLSGIVLFGPCVALTQLLHQKPSHNKEYLVWTILTIASVPAALFHNSSLLAYLAMLCFESALGFSMISGHLCLFIGFNDQTALERAVTASGLLLFLFIALRVARLHQGPLAIFNSAVTVFGTNIYLLGLSIGALSWSSSGDTRLRFLILSAISVTAAIAIGAVFHMEGLFNTGVTYAVTGIIEQFSAHSSARGYVAETVLLVSCLGYALSLYLHTHPYFVVSLFDGSYLN